jgi:hypothetical protein
LPMACGPVALTKVISQRGRLLSDISLWADQTSHHDIQRKAGSVRLQESDGWAGLLMPAGTHIQVMLSGRIFSGSESLAGEDVHLGEP